jgi:hypothetical protein
MKCLSKPVESFDSLGLALLILDLKVFSFYFESSTIVLARELDPFYRGLATLASLERLVLHLHVQPQTTSM